MISTNLYTFSQDMIDEPHTTESIMRLQKTQICNSLLHRIRLIQGRTNLNFNEPHFIESKDSVRQTKDIIQSIKEGLQKGYSELIQSCEQNNRFNSETNSSLTEKLNKKNKLKRQIQKTNSDKIESKQSRNKKGTIQEVVDFYEGAEKQAEVPSGIKLSQIFLNNEEHQDLQPVSSIVINDKGNNKKKKKRKRKQDENDSNSSLTQSRSKCNLKKASQQGDAISLKPKTRKNKFRRNRKRLECSGDESDVEEDISSCKIGEEHFDQNLQTQDKPRRKLRNKQRPKTPNLASFRKQDRPPIADFKEMVSTTIARLNTVNESVQKVIEDSMSSSSSLTKKISFPDVQTSNNAPYLQPTMMSQNLNQKNASVSSISWSTVTITNANDNSEASVVTQKPSYSEKPVQPPKKVVPPKKSSDAKNKQPPSENLQSSTTACLEQTSTTKKGKLHPVENRIKKDIEKVLSIEKAIAPKKKKTGKKREEVIEPVSSMKKAGKKKKSKNVVNFNTVPEVVPNYTPEPSAVVLPTKPAKSVRAALNETFPSVRQSAAKSSSKDESGKNTQIKSKYDNRRVSSARNHRNVHKKLVPRVKSTGNISPDPNKPLSVRTVLQEEAKNLEELKQQRSRSRSANRSEIRTGSSSRSGSQKRNEDTRTKVMEIYQKVRSNTTECIANVNEQMSFTLKESIAHLNEICGKVRTTLTDMEKDEENYKKLKSNKSFEVSSEGGSVHDGSISAIQTSKRNPPSTRQKPEVEVVQEVSATPRNQTYTVITEPIPDTRIGELIQNLSMAGDNVVVEHPQPQTKEKKKRPNSSKTKRRRSAATKPPKTPSASSSKAKIEAIVKSTSAVKTNTVKIPIWQRTPPSVIEEIQLTVKKQATKSQYREFLRALKSIAKKERSQVHVMPCEFKEVMEKQQDTAFNEAFKHKPVRRRKESRIIEETQLKKSCQNCLKDKCTCGVIVENTSSLHNQQRMHWMHVRNDSKRGIQAYDILDEITLKDLEPIQSEYPRKDHISDTDANKRIEETLLYKLLYHEDPKVLEGLLRSTPVSDTKTSSQISNCISAEKQQSASNAYKLYEQLEFNTDKDKMHSHSLSTTKASMCIASPEPQKFTVIEKPKPLHTCPKEFNDEVNIPADLKPTLKPKYIKQKTLHVKSKDDTISMRSRKRIEDKLKIIGKTASIKSIGKRIRNGKISKENIKAKLKGYNVESDIRMKKILTVMPVCIVTKSNKTKSNIAKTGQLSKSDKDEQNLTKKNVEDMQITPENLEKIQKMSKREIVQILKPYIFHDLQPNVIVAMPVIPKYNHQNKPKQDSPHSNRSSTYKRVAGYLKDHDDDCRSGKKLCRRCQMSMQCGDESKANNVTSRRSEPLNQRQLWKTKYKPTPAENLVTKVLGKNHSRRKFEAIPPNERSSNKDMVINVSPMELNKNANSTRTKLKEVKDIMETHKTLLGQNLDDIIDTLEFKIVDALANPKNQHTDAFNEIEFEIKSILNTINELKEINKDNIQKSARKFKSKTSTSLADSSDQMIGVESNKNITDVNLLQNRNKSSTDESWKDDIEKNPPIRVKTPEAVKRISTVEVTKEKELDDTYCSLGNDIRKVIEGLDAIMNLDEEDEKAAKTVKTQEVTDTQIPQKKSATAAESAFAPSECEQAITSFCEQVDEVMKSIRHIEDLNASTDNLETDVEEKKSDDYLTPFMRAVKDYRNSDAAQNFIDFLDQLTMISNDSVSLHIYPNIPYYRTTLQQNPEVFEVAKTFNQAVQHEGLNSDKAVGVTIVEDTLVEQESDESKNSLDKSIGVEDRPLTAKDFMEETNDIDEINVDNKDYILCTNQWMQTDEAGLMIPMEDFKNEIVQTLESQVQFDEIKGYKMNINCGNDQMNRIKTTILISDKKTQVPSEDGHCCYIESCTRDAQVTRGLTEMTCITVGNQVDYTTVEVISAECQVISRADLGTPDDPIYDGSSDKELSSKQMSSVDAMAMEKYTSNRLESCFGVNPSDISIDEYPRNIYTETFVTRDRYEQITDALMCDKRNSYPITKIRQNQSDLISLFENHKSISRDFLEEGFGKAPDESYDSMLARYASSENAISSTPSVETTVERIVTPQSNPKTSVNIQEIQPPLDKLIMDEEDYDKRHKHLLHSVYGLVFTLMFLGINLNYSCCN